MAIMGSIITKMQQKSDAEKTVLAMTAAVVITGLLFVTWGYNFAHSGQINNLASSAAGVADAVESADLGDNFNNALEQLKALGGISSEQQGGQEVVTTNINEDSSVGMRHINVFAVPESASGQAQEYGDNSGDVLY